MMELSRLEIPLPVHLSQQETGNVRRSRTIILEHSGCHHCSQVDVEIIKNLKFHCRYTLANRKLEASVGVAPFSWNILDAIIALKSV